jgi:tRNA A-37 threonylcarbamoyl transferase component Bud32
VAEPGIRVAGGVWHLRTASVATDDTVALAERLRHARWSGVEAVSLGGRDGVLKGGRLSGSASRRHGLRRLLGGPGAPRLREFANLEWLRTRDFLAPEPLAAGAFLRFGVPRYHFLVTSRVPESRPLLEELEGTTPEREALVDEAAREIAGLHAASFHHHDLYLRNLLVAPPRNGRRLWFLDAWAGGPGHGSRGSAHDLACFFLDAAGVLSPAEQQRFLSGYLRAREDRGCPADAGRLLRHLVRVRRRLLRRARREPGRLRGRTPPGPDWFPSLGEEVRQPDSVAENMNRRS